METCLNDSSKQSLVINYTKNQETKSKKSKKQFENLSKTSNDFKYAQDTNLLESSILNINSDPDILSL